MIAESKKYKVILVDDDKFLLDMYAMKLKKENVEVVTIENGEELLNKLKQGLTGDLLLLDIIMPGVDGLEVLERLRKDNLFNDKKVVALTNQEDPVEIKKAETLGIDEYIVKARNTPSEVTKKIMAILKAKK